MYKRSGDDEDGRAAERKKKRRSRWAAANEDKAFIPGMPTVLPSNMTPSQQEEYLVHLQIEDISRKLRSGDLGIPHNPDDRSPSPEPIYNNEGKRLNTREYRTRKRLEEDRHNLVQKALIINDTYKPPADYKPPIVRVHDKVMIPQEDHPDINFVGLLIGPRGNTLKKLEKDTGAKIIIRGKGSVKEGKIGRKDGAPLPGEDEPLHAYVTANNPENVKLAVDKIKEIIEQGIDMPEGQNDLRREQLRELALLNGTLRENDGLMKLKQIQEAQTIYTNTILCTVCGGSGHLSQDCKQKRPGDTFRAMNNPNAFADKAKMDSEYMSLMAELGEGPPPQKERPPPGCNMRPPNKDRFSDDKPFGGGDRFGDRRGPPGGGPGNYGPGPRGPPPNRDIPGLMNLRPEPSRELNPRQTTPWQSGPPGPPGPPRDNGAPRGNGPPPSLLSAPPPPPPSGQGNNFGGWQPPPRGPMMGVPPPPPTTSSTPWSSYNTPPWQAPSPVAPPPPPPPSGFGVPPPPPPASITPLLGAPPPPPPPK